MTRILILTLLLASQLTQAAVDSTVAPTSAATSDLIRSRIEHLMFTGDLEINGVPIISGEILGELYAARQYQSLWPDREKIAQLELLSEYAYQNGLDPKDYPLPAVQELLDAPQPLTAVDAADLDILATETLIRIGYQLRFGKVNPAGLFSDWNFLRELQSGVARNQTIEQLVAEDSLVDALNVRLQRAELYLLLKQALATYRDIEARGGWSVVSQGPVLRAGDVDERVIELRTRLLVEGELTPASDPALFDEPLTEAVMQFQRRHGLDADGVVGAGTLQAMNVLVAFRIDQLRASLERARWVFGESRAAGDRLLLVNIASAQLALMVNGKPTFITRVQVGKPYRQTPVFQGLVEYLVFNPTWTVPPTILRQDVLPQLKVDADAYLTSKHMDLLDRDGNKVDHNAIDWDKITAAQFPYMVRQRPGPWNSLGQVKFIFPNSHFVFLHDTPSQELFDRADRAFSSGCIRVEHPFELAELLLNESKWNMPAFQSVLDTQREQVVHLAQPVPIFLMYWTGMADRDGTVRFYEDIYGRDAVLLKALGEEPVLNLDSSD